ncbi:hypothetical protein [Aquisalimonas sp.]|uniref:hypothetical protein n=1 Tax=Aquisalimonas sp. TaxID=1872621 RepID=UPI0025C022F9|nr:hypothetical protein [Aquisalimonas sp.]
MQGRVKLHRPGTNADQRGFRLSYAVFSGYRRFSRLSVEAYEDNPVGYPESNNKKWMEMTRLVPSPRTTLGGDKMPDQRAMSRIHASVLRNCLIRNSITTEVTINYLELAISGGSQ